MPNARLFAVVTGTEENPGLRWLEQAVAVTPELLEMSAPVEPQRIFRIAVTCQESRCVHFDGQDCTLAQRIVDLVPPSADHLPRCAIRSACRWFNQEGSAACRRCPLVITHSYEPSAALREAATPHP